MRPPRSTRVFFFCKEQGGIRNMGGPGVHPVPFRICSRIKSPRRSVFLTGKAGTGKSTFLRYVCEHTKKKHVVLAPTGIAAINAGGSTMHSFFKLPFHPLLPDDPNLSLQKGRIHDFFKYTRHHRKRS